jgi:isoleucyl-tRNA synthetase
MGLVRTVVAMGRGLRSMHKIKTRQPLNEIRIITRNPQDQKTIEGHSPLIAQELNVKNVSFSSDEAKWVNYAAKPNAKILGPRLGQKMKGITQKIRELTPVLVAELEKKGSLVVEGETITREEVVIDRQPKQEGLIQTSGDVTVWLDTKLEETLILEGRARELVNRIQKLRKDLGFEVTDRIRVRYQCPPELKKAVEAFHAYVSSETLADKLEEADAVDWTVEQEIDEFALKLRVEKL